MWPSTGSFYGWVVKNLQFSSNIWLYLGNDTMCEHSDYEETFSRTLTGAENQKFMIIDAEKEDEYDDKLYFVEISVCQYK